jgi:hypothetical protein
MFKTQYHSSLPVEIASRDILNLGCGRKYIPDAINLDIVPDTHPDLLHDLNSVPWPLADNHFREVIASDVIEHLNDVMLTLEEIHRVCRHGAKVTITVPHFSCCNAFTDPTHRHYFGWSSFQYFTSESELSFYTRVRFRCNSSQIIFYPSLVNKLIWRLANRYPARYEQRWAWIFPAWFLSFELEVIKETDLDNRAGLITS